MKEPNNLKKRREESIRNKINEMEQRKNKQMKKKENTLTAEPKEPKNLKKKKRRTKKIYSDFKILNSRISKKSYQYKINSILKLCINK